MGNKVILKKIIIEEQRINYEYEVNGYWKKYFCEKSPLFVQYNLECNVPYEIAVIPFLCTVMPMAWMFNAKVYVEKVDNIFLNALEEYRCELKEMYNKLWLGETKIYSECVSHSRNLKSGNIATYFSGGVDAWGTLIENLYRTPYIITLSGADISFDNESGMEQVFNDTKLVAQKFGLSYITVITNLRKAINEKMLYKHLHKRTGGMGAWKSVWAGIGIVGMSAPISYILNLSEIYISTSVSENEKSTGGYKSALDSSLLEALYWDNCRICAAGKDTTRQDKIFNIVNFTTNKQIDIKLRACWQDSSGKNCCKCEKCYRTAMGVAATGQDPRKYGFEISTWSYLKIPSFISKKIKKGQMYDEDLLFWNEIKKRFKNKNLKYQWIKYYKLKK